jgi:hypothetical protein
MIAPHWADANKPHFPRSGSRRKTGEPVNQSRPGSPSHLLDSRLQGYELHPFFQITDCNASLSKSQIRFDIPSSASFSFVRKTDRLNTTSALD